MKKSYKIEVDCANCANLVEAEINKIEGVANATISFMTQKMKVEYAEGADVDAVLAQIIKVGKKVEPDFEVL
ncbi:MAG: heavy-metal-associated domain-containing protein [Muribaculaceae bacterium]|nr:heavy-metal-associated domain-containing protein [Muribaculaceae bacterium]